MSASIAVDVQDGDGEEVQYYLGVRVTPVSSPTHQADVAAAAERQRKREQKLLETAAAAAAKLEAEAKEKHRLALEARAYAKAKKWQCTSCQTAGLVVGTACPCCGAEQPRKRGWCGGRRAEQQDTDDANSKLPAYLPVQSHADGSFAIHRVDRTSSTDGPGAAALHPPASEYTVLGTTGFQARMRRPAGGGGDGDGHVFVVRRR